MTTHIPARCSLAGCAREAHRWLDGFELFGIGYPLRTLYLCDVHAEEVAHDDALVHWLNPLTRSVRTVELGVYDCSDACGGACRECNP